jgi:hypothetical protein
MSVHRDTYHNQAYDTYLDRQILLEASLNYFLHHVLIHG